MATDWTSALAFSLGNWDQDTINGQALEPNQPHASTLSGNLTPDSAYGTSTEGSPPMANTSTPEDNLTNDLFEWVFEKSLDTNKNSAPAEQTKDAPKAERKTQVNTAMKKTWNRFSIKQLDILESHFRERTYLSRQEMEALARKTRLNYKQVKTWFQNQRAKEKKHHSDSEWDAIRLSYSNCLGVQTSVPQHMPHNQKAKDKKHSDSDTIRYSDSNSLVGQTSVPQHIPHHYPVQQDNVFNQPPEISCHPIGCDGYYQYLTAWQQYAMNDWSMISSTHPMMAATPLYKM